MRRILLAVLLIPAISFAQTSVTRYAWGKTADGRAVDIYTVADVQLSVRITSFGAHVVSIEAPDRDGKKADVVLGYTSLAGYEADTSTFIGAVPGRYANRIAHGTFEIDGNVFHGWFSPLRLERVF